MPSISKWLRGATGRTLGLGLLTFFLIAPLSFLPWGQFLENLILDFCYQWRSPLPPPSNLLVVGIDEASFQELGQSWPWPRRLHATLIQRLNAAGAGLIVFDILFADPTTPEDDQLLAAAIRQAGNVVLGETIEVTRDPRFNRRIMVQPLEPFRRAATGVGLEMITPDPDGVVRHFQLRIGNRKTLSAVATQSYQPQRSLSPELTGLINYVGPPRSLDTVSFYQVLDPDHPLPAERIRGRIVLVGRMLEASVTPQAQADAFYTPYFSLTGQLMSGVEIHGQIIHTLLSGQWGRELSASGRVWFYLVILLISAYLLARFPPLAGLGVLIALCALILGGSIYLFLYQTYFVPPLLLTFGAAIIYTANALCHYLVVAKEKRWLRQAFSRYLSDSLIEVISSHPDRLRLGGEEVEVTVLFSDLAGFTSISEGMPPSALIELLNEHFSTMTEIILTHHGTLDKYIGDAIMALWGAPLPIPNHASLACEAALEMHRAMQKLQEVWESRGLPRLSCRMGLHSGLVIAGNVGSRRRFNYTVMGDTVNLASRLEGVNKVYGTEILLSEATYRQVAHRFLIREVDLILVKGRSHPTAIYELLDYRAEEEPEWLLIFASGRAAYRHGQWALAQKCFQEVLRLKPTDSPTMVYLERCQQYQHLPPPPDWQGVFVLDSK
ncbi:MAG: CHASE2 domain-containing protein [Deltaproteobacteria bacterium]|nr:CHASE2 domain-containing protein [Deltaproteobacteria bacterium]MBW1952127.1 CHASE2 domain-containing protein [Deltaproteobacteria bacterium]MBW1986184.1 CHASE2 domain-containing protein [Deltaproteobacteria bacterium]MBW2134938.1 CHASE2 domain-containing protein [Deltaproteobacteria bacterium]